MCGLVQLPGYICHLYKLQTMLLSGNKLTQYVVTPSIIHRQYPRTDPHRQYRLPMSLSLFSSLKKLDLSYNQLSDHSTKPGNFPVSLTELNLSYNRWNSFPRGIVVSQQRYEIIEKNKRHHFSLVSQRRGSDLFYESLKAGVAAMMPTFKDMLKNGT